MRLRKLVKFVELSNIKEIGAIITGAEKADPDIRAGKVYDIIEGDFLFQCSFPARAGRPGEDLVPFPLADGMVTVTLLLEINGVGSFWLKIPAKMVDILSASIVGENPRYGNRIQGF